MKVASIVTTFACSLLLTGTLLRPPIAQAVASEEDKQFLSMAAQSDMNEIKLSQLAEAKASNPQVKSFAHKMVSDHNMLEVKMKPFAAAWGLTPPAGLDSDHQAIYDKLNGLSGADFHKAYTDAMAEDHHKALEAFTKESATTQDAKFKAPVTKGKTVVAAHTKMADSLKSKLSA